MDISVDARPQLYEVELEREVRSWLDGLTDRDFGRVDFLVGLLAERAETLDEPCSRHLGGKVRNCDFSCCVSRREWRTGGRRALRVILLTDFRKTRNAEIVEVQRTADAQRSCEATHVVANHI